MLRMAARLALAVFLVLACSAGARAGATTSFDDTARFLAGLPPSAGSPAAALTKDPGWQSHASAFDKAWGPLDAKQLTAIRAWTATHLKDGKPAMLYMFSGPDYLYANAIFPDATTYVLSGLEPVGSVPELTGIPQGALDRDLAELRASLNSVLSFSFFITKKMKTDLASGRLTGTLPVLYVFLARAGKTVTDMSYVTLDKDGAEISGTDAGSAAKGVKISFKDAGGRAQTLYYFSTDLSNGGVAASGFLAFCKRLGPADSLLKSASYLMHSENFSTVRNFVLAESARIVEDDSGIPAHAFEPKSWKLTPYGAYLGPISLFNGKSQDTLRRLFQSSPKTPIDFSFGYRWRARESNLVIAEKGDYAVAAGEAVTSTVEREALASQPEAKKPRSQRAKSVASSSGSPGETEAKPAKKAPGSRTAAKKNQGFCTIPIICQ